MVEVNAFVQNIDYVPSNIPLAVGPASLCLLEDNEPVIKMAIKRRWPQLKYVPRIRKLTLTGFLRGFPPKTIATALEKQ